MRRILLATAAALAVSAGPACATIVSDPPVEMATMMSLIRDIEAAAKRVEMINNQVAQLIELKATVAAIMHGDVAALSRLAPELAAIGVTVPMGTDMQQLAKSISGLARGAGTTAALTRDLLNTDTLYLPSGSDFRAVAMNQIATAAASQKALGELMLRSSADRLTALNSARLGLGQSADLKASADAAARFSAEQAVTQAQTNQLLAASLVQRAQTTTNEVREQQAWRCSAEALVARAQAASSAANAGSVVFSNGSGTSSCSSVLSASVVADGTSSLTGNSTYSASNNNGMLTGGSATPDDGTTLGKMLAQSWGQTAANNATALGVNPIALAATCALESNCSANVGGTGTISGAFQMTNGTYAQTVREVQTSNPDLASTITTKTDPASQSIAAAQYLKDGANALTNAGISNPTVLDVRGYYQFGPVNAASIAGASDNQLMSQVVTGLSSATLTANGIRSTTTVGQWRQSVTNKIGTAASQSVLVGSQT